MHIIVEDRKPFNGWCFLAYSSANKIDLNSILWEYFMSKLVSQVFFSHTFLCYFNEIGSEVLQDITATNEGIVTNSNILVGSVSVSSRQSSESLVWLLLFSINFDVFLSQEAKFKYKHSSQSHEYSRVIISLLGV